jgi:hypothetical protein
MGALQSDIVFNVSKFLPSTISAETAAFNEVLMDRTAGGIHLREVIEFHPNVIILRTPSQFPDSGVAY